jgi:hypothetical protein
MCSFLVNIVSICRAIAPGVRRSYLSVYYFYWVPGVSNLDQWLRFVEV